MRFCGDGESYNFTLSRFKLAKFYIFLSILSVVVRLCREIVILVFTNLRRGNTGLNFSFSPPHYF